MLIIRPAVGIFNFDTATAFSSNSTPNYSYTPSSNGSPSVAIGSLKGHGQLTITKFDSVSHRVSGSFNFSGVDPSTGRTVQITNGVINNLQWFVI